ncbi:ETC complex I subunit [Geminicoccus flavidas]|uniref:ETC complex I subunit n=1 Tax=Geminicoccus flavidas TaxID=2506407 RepID=UPI001359AF80|nr:ETC complex I subunit [Geminicoccus flavidas]
MPDARIYQPAKTAVQSGRAKTRYWLLEMEPRSRKEPDRLIGWVGSDDTEQQVVLKFPTKEAALAYAERHGLSVQVDEPQERIVRPKSYADNFIRRF